MALVRLGGGAEARGSLGGITYSRNRGGAYMRSRVKPVNPKSDRQTQVRNAFTQAVNAWVNALASYREEWDTYAGSTPTTNKIGDQIFLTGQQMFVRQYVPAVQAGLNPVPAAAPVVFDRGTQPTLGDIEIVPSNGITIALPAQAWKSEVGATMLIFMSRPQNASRKYVRRGFALVGSINGAATPPTSFTGTTPYPVGTGQQVTIRCTVRRADGRYSTATDVLVTVAAP